ncbi:hypothetical protein Tc00.1047053506721.50 [Trypanosoma cruzi]|uniref:Transmembrane protein n=1 Tax=Trypanosoma cruzi (strain CL Brener) TaxID=353153 RepID=Q4D6I9_TRYCC|nr:hypothetical protein Tc00.1047053506721.50 [Trypanosoma cruzi]EAN88143.1 hypothetical protein Tc00.1047053506721.50 [Trypanosoma cruzi]|eukprot:XP_809994.1 hypothetical protein [Trypanosoma cruzi strain CL Brener]
MRAEYLHYSQHMGEDLGKLHPCLSCVCVFTNAHAAIYIYSEREREGGKEIRRVWEGELCFLLSEMAEGKAIENLLLILLFVATRCLAVVRALGWRRRQHGLLGDRRLLFLLPSPRSTGCGVLFSLCQRSSSLLALRFSRAPTSQHFYFLFFCFLLVYFTRVFFFVCLLVPHVARPQTFRGVSKESNKNKYE